MFDRLIPLLQPSYQLVAFDFSGHGRSGSPPDAYDFDRLRFEYEQVMDALDLPWAHILGFSMGGMAALRLALAASHRVGALVLMNTSAEAQPFGERQLLKILAGLTTAVGIRHQTVELAVHLMFSEAFRRVRPDIVSAWRYQAAAMSPTAAAKTTRLIADRDSVLDSLRRLATPALVIGSTLDTATPVKHSYRLAAALPRARLRVLSDVGHGTPLEAPEACAWEIHDFLDQAASPLPRPSGSPAKPG